MPMTPSFMPTPEAIDHIRADASDPDLWLRQCAANVHSQHGEDGLLAAALNAIGDRDGWCVEFGAWDGKHLSNTYRLIDECGYYGVLIEGDRRRYQHLKQNLGHNERVIPIHSYVGFDADNGLDQLLQKTPIPKNFDLLSVDIDGNDYHVWEAVRSFQPKIVVIEYNPTIPGEVDFVQPRDVRIQQGNSLAALCRLGKSKGYELIATTVTNAIFVDSSYFPLLGIRDNSLAKLWKDTGFVTHVFSGYDGHIFFRGNCGMPWHRVQYDETRMQLLPEWCQDHPPNYGPLKRLYLKLQRLFFKIRRHLRPATMPRS